MWPESHHGIENRTVEDMPQLLAFAVLCQSGAPNTIRTCDPRLRRAVLYPSELWARKIQDAGLGKTNRIAFFLSAVHSDNFALCFNKHVSMQYNDHFFLRELL